MGGSDVTEYASADDLAADVSTVDTADVTLSTGKVVKVRGLSRYELLLNGKNTEDSGLIERRNVACCMVEPRMTVGQVEAWQKGSKPADLGKVTAAIRDLSGLGEGADKSDVQEV